MIIKSANLETVCGVTSTLPENDCPEIAFAGKSNVGKSSLINTLLDRKKLARTSSSPGKTQTINFYKINRSFYLVDLPGYGYAKASAQAKEAWGKMIENYLRHSRALRAVFLLIDIRHDPGENDIQMYNWILETGFVPVIIATKADKLSRTQIERQTDRIRRVLQTDEDICVIPFSSVSGQGKEEVRRKMVELTGISEPDIPDPAAESLTTADPEKASGRKARWPKEERHKAARKKRKGRNGI